MKPVRQVECVAPLALVEGQLVSLGLESLLRLLEIVQSEQQPNSSEKMSGELRVCINHDY